VAISEQRYRAEDGIVAMLMDGGMMASKVVRMDRDPGRSRLFHAKHQQAEGLPKLQVHVSFE
jgi:hypothetical protein